MVGVGQPARFACRGNWSSRSEPSALGLMSAPLSFQSLVVGVTQPAIAAVGDKYAPFCPGPSPAIGVGHPVRAVSDMGRADARSRKRDCPEGVTHGFQVSLYKVDPSVDSLARNLFSKDDWNVALLLSKPGDVLLEQVIEDRP